MMSDNFREFQTLLNDFILFRDNLWTISDSLRLGFISEVGGMSTTGKSFRVVPCVTCVRARGLVA
jgi:hypothetical protein